MVRSESRAALALAPRPPARVVGLGRHGGPAVGIFARRAGRNAGHRSSPSTAAGRSGRRRRLSLAGPSAAVRCQARRVGNAPTARRPKMPTASVDAGLRREPNKAEGVSQSSRVRASSVRAAMRDTRGRRVLLRPVRAGATPFGVGLASARRAHCDSGRRTHEALRLVDATLGAMLRYLWIDA